MALVAARQDFGKRRLAGGFPQRLERLDRLGDLGPAALRLGDYAGDGLAVAGDADCAPALHFVQKLGPFGFGFGRLISRTSVMF